MVARTSHGLTAASRDADARVSGEVTLKTMRGYTLMEVIITMSIVAILMTIGIPSFRYITNANRIAGEINGLLGDMQFARAEAIKEGQNVSVCVSANGTSCSGPTINTWQNGWIVFSYPANTGVVDALGETVLRVQPPFSSTDTFVASNTVGVVTFNREGYATGILNGALITLQTAPSTTSGTRCLSINLVGLMKTQKHGDVANGVTCT
jgi:type IV fimbrial biogenesis protein FimT